MLDPIGGEVGVGVAKVLIFAAIGRGVELGGAKVLMFAAIGREA